MTGQYGPEWEQRLDAMVAAWRARRARRKSAAEAFRAARSYGLSRRYAAKVARRVVERAEARGKPFIDCTPGERVAEVMVANVAEKADAMTRAAQEREARREARKATEERDRPFGAPW